MKILMILSKEFTISARAIKETKSLIEAGHQVKVLMWDRKGDYEQINVYDGLEVIRTKNTALMKSLPNDLFRNPFWWKLAYKKSVQLYTSRFKFDVVHCKDLDTLRIGVHLKKKFGIKLVFDVYDLFYQMIEGNVPKIVSEYSFGLEKRLLKYIDHIITPTEPLYYYYIVFSDKPVSLVMNVGYVYDKIPEKKNNVFTICYTGSIEKNRMFPEVIECLALVPNIKIVIIALSENVEMCKKIEKIINSDFVKADIQLLYDLNYDKMMDYVSQFDCMISPLNPAYRIYRYALASKQFDAMSCGKPVICTKGTYAGDLTEKLNCGLVVDYNPDAIKKAVIKLRDNPKLCEEFGKNGYKAVKKIYNWEKQKIKLLKVYEEIK